VPPANTERLAAMLKKAGAEVELFWHTGGHQITREELEHARLWLSNTSGKS